MRSRMLSIAARLFGVIIRVGYGDDRHGGRRRVADGDRSGAGRSAARYGARSRYGRAVPRAAAVPNAHTYVRRTDIDDTVNIRDSLVGC